jgi:predicted aspartyl protease
MAILAASSTMFAFGLLSASLPEVRQVRHEIPLRPTIDANGAVIGVQINGHRLHLLLDTGARDLVLGSKAASRCGLRPQNPQSTLSAIGGSSVPAASTAARIDIGGLQIPNVPVRILADSPVRQADGLIGAQVFRSFLLEIDMRAGRLRLLSHGEAPGAIALREVGHMLFVPLDDGQYALVDTGASFSVIDQTRVSATADMGSTPIRMASGVTAQARKVATPARFDLGNGSVLWDRNPLAFDLSALSRKHGLDVRAVIGYPALRGSVMQLDYQQRTLRILE